MVLNTKEVTPLGVFTSDIFSEEYAKKRRIYITDEITGGLANEVCAAINHLESVSSDDIWLIITCSPGGSVAAGNAIIDTMNTSKCDICTVVLGQAASMAAVIASSGTKGKRYIGESAQMMIHQALGGASGQATDILRIADNIRKVNERLFKTLAENTGKPVKQISEDCDRDYFMYSDEAIAYGLADKVFSGWK